MAVLPGPPRSADIAFPLLAGVGVPRHLCRIPYNTWATRFDRKIRQMQARTR